MGTDCIFCKIVGKELPAEVISETDDLLAFKDKFPSAPIHYAILNPERFCSFAILVAKFFISTHRASVISVMSVKCFLGRIYVILPKKHFTDITEITDALWVEMKNLATKIAKEQNLSGFRIATNAGDTAMISHMHLHFLAGIHKDRSV